MQLLDAEVLINYVIIPLLFPFKMAIRKHEIIIKNLIQPAHIEHTFPLRSTSSSLEYREQQVMSM